MFILGATFSQIFSVLSTIFMIWMIVDCIRNQCLVHKGAWICFILFTQFIGAAVYFFTRGPWSKVKQYLFPHNSPSVYQAPQVPNNQAPSVYRPIQEPFPDYAQGYQAQRQNPMSSSQERIQALEVPSLRPEYEEPLIAYPEMPPMQQEQYE
ncbi:MAG TPA: PLDc N-terminal domain-containing protein [Ktedonobacteraceae bacterium]|nr:PLDc N-terminal domain-containing protein [Ktedonobacteraceae bacterium]